jgi:GT2 family glycosyltransferase
MPPKPPRVAVVLPLYRSAATLRSCLAALAAQTFRDFSVQLVDSSPDESSAEIAAAFPAFEYWYSPSRMWPQEARNAGVARSSSEILVFSDPDCYAAPDWLERLVRAHDQAGGEPVVGALACHGRRWLDRGLHLAKFSKWLPGRRARSVDMGPTANLLCSRELYASAGGFTGDMLLGDATFSWILIRAGHELRFASDAVVEHHHLDTLGEFLRERWRRGRLYGALRHEWTGGGRWRALAFFAVSALPVRLASNVGHTFRHAIEARALLDALRTAPVILLGHAASLAGEARAYARAGFGAKRTARPAPVRPAIPPPRIG